MRGYLKKLANTVIEIGDGIKNLNLDSLKDQLSPYIENATKITTSYVSIPHVELCNADESECIEIALPATKFLFDASSCQKDYVDGFHTSYFYSRLYNKNSLEEKDKNANYTLCYFYNYHSVENNEQCDWLEQRDQCDYPVEYGIALGILFDLANYENSR